MTTNIERLKGDLKTLGEEGTRLQFALLVRVHGIDKIAQSLKLVGDDKKKFKDNLPQFNQGYEAWYSQAVALVKQLLPDRLQDFKEHFEAQKNRKDITFATYRIQDALQGLRVTRGPLDDVVVDDNAAIPHFLQQLAMGIIPLTK